MKFMYMDESGKCIISQHEPIFIFGGLIVDRSQIRRAIGVFKSVHDEYRTLVRDIVNKHLPKDQPPVGRVSRRARNEDETSEELFAKYMSKSSRMQRMFEKFEFHAADMFKPAPKAPSSIFESENPWSFFPESELPKILNNLLAKMKPYIEKAFVFTVLRDDYKKFYQEINQAATDTTLNDDMLCFVLEEYRNWLHEHDVQGAIIADQLDKTIRSKFVFLLEQRHNDGPMWMEPITVESHNNAFTQLIDLITYCYRMVKLRDENKISLSAVERIYKKQIKDYLCEKDLVDFLRSKLSEQIVDTV